VETSGFEMVKKYTRKKESERGMKRGIEQKYSQLYVESNEVSFVILLSPN
jgi:hypothetical protein